MTEDNLVWEPVSNGSQNDYPLAFVNVHEEDDSVTFNVDGEEGVEPEDGDGPMLQGEYRGLVDISAEDNPQPSMKHLIESESDERTYAINNVKALSSQLEDVEEGEVVGVDFEGYVEPEDGLPWQNFTVYKPAQ